MDKKEKENKNNSGNFKAVSNSSFPSYSDSSSKTNFKFGKTVFIPFISGVVGAVVVLGTCFGVSSIRNKVLGNSTNLSSPSSSSSNSGYVSQTSLSAYSDTSIYAANKVLPSIVGISVEYTVSSGFSFFSGGEQTGTAKATGSGIIISENGYILTNNHIVSSSSSDNYYEVSEANKVTIKLYNDETEYEGQIVGKDEQSDLAIIKIDLQWLLVIL